MQRVGYTVKVEQESEVQALKDVGGCEKIIRAIENEDKYVQFSQFINDHANQQLVVVNVESIGLQLIQLAPLLERIQVENITLLIVENRGLLDSVYIQLLLDIARGEKSIISQRTLRGLRKAHANGSISGRPKIKAEIIDRINFLYYTQKKTLREISDMCQVSLGTVHKYINLKS